MPNWCVNRVYIYGPNLDDFAAAVASTESAFDFNKIIPMPKSVCDTEASSDSSLGIQLLGAQRGEQGTQPPLNFTRYPFVGSGVTTYEEALRYVKEKYPKIIAAGEACNAAFQETGHYNWYAWANSNWGTKWNASDVIFEPQPGKRRIFYSFNTAWSPPLPVFHTLGEKFPQHTISIHYYEGGVGFQGKLKLRGSEILGETSGTYRGRRGG